MKSLKMISLSLVLVCILSLGAAQANTASEAVGRLEVTGNAVITGAPDTARIILGVETSSTSADSAASENAERMARVLGALKNMGIQESKISTGGYNIYSYRDTFQRTTLDETSEQTIYNVHNRITIITHELDQVGKIVDAAVKAGANQVQSVDFDLTDKQDMQLQALDAAIKQAMVKANVMAESAGVALGGIVSIEEAYGTYVARDESVHKMVAGFGGAETSITPGEVEVTAQVSMVFWF